MPASYAHFRLLPFEQQLPLIWVEGTFLATRWEEEDAVGLYHMAGGFFSEVYYDGEDKRILNVQCFTSSAFLENYSHGISLGDLTT
jgi:hypothetical protein